MKRFALWLLAALAVAFVLIQLKPVVRDNPPVEETVAAPAEVMALLRRSCFDCHSHETRWPWYSRVAPASWLVADDVHHAREHLDFSTWNRYGADERADLFEEIAEEVSEGAMPLPIYLVGHPGARPSEAERAQIAEWATAAAGEAERAAEMEEEASPGGAAEAARAEEDGDGGRGRGRGRGGDDGHEHDHDHDHDDHEHD
jgi:hypothetical protein